jgi:tRNA (guanine37-N1)-methyltransferase
MTFHAQILTLYPEMFPGPLGVSIAGRALAERRWSCSPIQIRDFATDKHRTVDDTPAGGGSGMVLRADVLAAAVDFAQSQILPELVSGRGTARGVVEGYLPEKAPPSGLRPATSPSKLGEDFPILALTPRGTPITQARIRELAKGPGVTLICGRFEGFDERLFEARPEIEQVSVGDIILSGGEPAALMLLDACIRLLPGVMGAASSGDEESFENGLLEYPHYTKAQSEIDTRLRRPDLWERHVGARVQPASDARRKNKDHMGHEPHPDDRSGTDRKIDRRKESP